MSESQDSLQSAVKGLLLAIDKREDARKSIWLTFGRGTTGWNVEVRANLDGDVWSMSVYIEKANYALDFIYGSVSSDYLLKLVQRAFENMVMQAQAALVEINSAIATE